MKLYITLVALFAFNANASEALSSCKKEIFSSTPYGRNAIIDEPSRMLNDGNKIIYDWEDFNLRVTVKDGTKPYATGRCVYNKDLERVIFLNVYSDTIISNYPIKLNSLRSATKKEAYILAKKLGLSDQEISWIKRNGHRTYYGFYNLDGNVIGIAKHSKKDLMHLDKLQIINLYPDKSNENQYLSVSTSISMVLSEKL